MDFGAALMAVLTVGVVKVAVMAFSAWLVWKIHGATRVKPPRRLWLLLPRENLPEVRLLWWALVLFFVSEMSCGIEIYILLQSSAVLSGIHALTSAAGMGLFALGAYRFLDGKALRFAGQACLGRRVCRECTVVRPEGCRFSLALALSAVFVSLSALVPLFASTAPLEADVAKYILPFPSVNQWYDQSVVPWLAAHVPGYQKGAPAYVITHAMLVMELRIIPLVACAVGGVATYHALRRKVRRATELAVFGAGILAYAYFELIIYRGTGDALLGSLGHEVGELWFLLICAELLRQSFPAGSVRAVAA